MRSESRQSSRRRTDAPFDAQAGAYFIRRTTADIEVAIDNQTHRDAIFEHNAHRILGIEPAVDTHADQAA